MKCEVYGLDTATRLRGGLGDGGDAEKGEGEAHVWS